MSTMNKVTNILGWLGTAAVVVSLGLRYQTTRPEWQQYSWWAAVAGLVFIAAYIASQWREIAQAFQRRQTRLGAMSATGIVLVLGIIVAANYLVSRRNYRWDLTANKLFSLSDQTRQILQKLDAPVKVTVFDKPSNYDQFRERLGEFAYASGGKLTLDYIDLDRSPALATQNKVTAYGTVLFAYKDKTERVTSTEERDLTNALLKLTTGRELKVYFVQGHGERDRTSSERDGYAAASRALESDNYTVESLTLVQQKEVPADADVVIIAGPKSDLLEEEVTPLKRYLAGGGKLLVLLDPPDSPTAEAPANLMALLREWSVQVGNNVVVDVSGLSRDASAVFAVDYKSHAIGERLRGFLTMFPVVRSVEASSEGGRTGSTFIESSAASWAEADLKSFYSGAVEFKEGADRKGPISLGVAVTAPAAADGGTETKGDPSADGDKADLPKRESRVAVVGDADFPSNRVLGFQANRDLFLNIVGWLAQQENTLSIRPREAGDTRLTLSPGQQQLVVWGPLVAVPALALVAGLYVRKRRNG